MKRECIDTDSPEFQGSILWRILESIVGIAVCILVLLLCWLIDFQGLLLLFYLFIGAIIGWFYCLFHGRRSKAAAYAVVGVCTMLACLLWMPVLLVVRLNGEIPLSQFMAFLNV